MANQGDYFVDVANGTYKWAEILLVTNIPSVCGGFCTKSILCKALGTDHDDEIIDEMKDIADRLNHLREMR